MHAFIDLLHRFRRDERGVFAIIFAVMAIVIVAMAGATVDFVSMQQARTRAQLALDAAALALQPSIYTKTTTELKTQAQALLVERVADSSITATVTQVTTNTTDGVIHIDARLVVPTNFVKLIGFRQFNLGLLSEATRKRLNLEVVMVLDNSNSMSSSSRMTNLIAAAKCASNILLNGDCASTASTTSTQNTYIGFVPFTMEVNVGTSNASASWLDRSGNGAGNITTDNFDDDDTESTTFAGPVDRINLFSRMKYNNVTQAWGGCVEARKTPYDTNDTTPTSSNQDTMFTPYMAPDEPDSGGFNNNYLSDTPTQCPRAPSCVHTQTKTQCTTNTNYNTATCSGTTTDTYSYTNENGNTSNVASCPATAYNQTGSYTDATSNTTTSTNPTRYTLKRVRTWTYPFSQRELQERLCKYYSNVPLTQAPSQDYARGPNSDCPVNPITPLTSNKATITAAINAMDPQGGTNIHEGTAWGFRVLSPTEPFTQGLPYSANTSKVMIIMTDGENTAYQTSNMNNSTFYSAYGFPYNGRMGTASSTNAQLETEMNARTLATCNAAKAAGITVYTIGLSVDLTDNPTTNTNMLKNCSSGAGYAYFPTASSQLTSVFTTIAQQLSALRIVK